MSKQAEQNSLENAQPASAFVSRNPKHFENSTRNIKLPNGSIRKIHIRLVRVFNNKKVI